MTKLIFLDLDKTLIGEDYSPEPARPIIEKLISLGFHIAFNSSKTFKEQLYYAREFGIDAILIVENGSAIYFPKNVMDGQNSDAEGFERLKLGVDYGVVLRELDRIADRYCLKYYGNSMLEEVIGFTGLPEALARLAMQREFSETVFRYCSDGFVAGLEGRGFRVTRGSRFLTVTGQVDKGTAARIVLERFRQKGNVFSVAVGDGENDIPMLEVADLAIVVGDLDYDAVHVDKIERIFELLS